jgi:glycosyltransferase involved in cell wall biosynthesis
VTTVSVVIPTRNRRELLSEAIATVHDQTFQDWEIIVVDDQSTDDTPGYLRGLRDQRISSICHHHNEGPSVSRNDGLAAARGELVMFLDDDDLLRRRTLERLVAALRAAPDAVAAAGACRSFPEDGDSVRPYRPARPYTQTMWREFLFGWWSNSGQNLYRTAIVRKVGGFDPQLWAVQDRKLWLQVAREGPVCVLPFVAMEYRQHAVQITKGPDHGPTRRAVWNEFIAGLPAAEQPAAMRVRRAADLVDQSALKRADRQFAAALALQIRACVVAPALLASPFLGRPLWWGIKKCLVRASAP